MARGSLRIYLGAAPGVGKTFAMLEEGHLLQSGGADVVVATAPEDGRPETAALLAGLELCPTPTPETRAPLDLDVDAVLARAPGIALVDDYARPNAAGNRNGARWQDVEDLLEAGIDVISTVDIRNLESLADVVHSITGAREPDTVPDIAVRRADQIELVDAAPEVLRQRLAEGKIYDRQHADAALANGFRLGNLAALRELALLWLADRVDEGLADYRALKGIRQAWPARERIVVGLTGRPEGQVLIRRAARILAGTAGGELHAVHVRRPSDGPGHESLKELELQRRLVKDVGGIYHSIGGDDPARILLEFARSMNASQIVLGTSRTRPLTGLFTTGVGARIIRDAGDIDIHLVPHEHGRKITFRQPASDLGRTRHLLGFILAVLLPPGLQLVLGLLPHDQFATDMLVHLTGTIAVALVGGLWPAVLAAVMASLIVNFFAVRPLGTLAVFDPEHILALLIFLVVAVAVSLVVGLSARRSKDARVAGAEAAALGELSRQAVAAENSVPAFLDQVREHFQAAGAVLWVREPAGRTADTWHIIHSTGAPPPSDLRDADNLEQLDDSHALSLAGRNLTHTERRLLTAFGAHLLAMLEREQLTVSRRENLRLAEGNKMRTSILRAVSHDLRTPLAGIKLAASSLRQKTVVFSPDEREELLATIESGADRLDGLVSNLLDMSRITADSVAPLIRPVYWTDVITEALRGTPADRLRIMLPDNMPPVDADPGMLERVIANLAENALKYAPDSDIVLAGAVGGVGSATISGVPASELSIVDHGQGIPADKVMAMFRPFQRADDTQSGSGIGLGLAVAKGFTEAMGGRLLAEPTPGGGLTMVIRMPLSTGTEPAEHPKESDVDRSDRR